MTSCPGPDNTTSIDEADVLAAWERNAPVWTDRVRAGADFFREARWRQHAAIFFYLAAEKPISAGSFDGHGTAETR